MIRPRFIALEGGEGVGKSTQAKRLAAVLRDRGLDVLETREPGGSAGAEAIRALLLGGAVDRWTPGAEALLFAAARSDHVTRTILPALRAGQWVVCDRFVHSSLAYQGGGDGLGRAAVRALHRVGSAGLLPDRALLLALPVAVGEAREHARDQGQPDRFGARSHAYHVRVARAFRELAREEPDVIRSVDASGPAEVVTGRLLDALADFLP